MNFDGVFIFSSYLFINRIMSRGLPSMNSKDEIVILRVSKALKKEIKEIVKKSKFDNASALIRSLLISESRK